MDAASLTTAIAGGLTVGNNILTLLKGVAESATSMGNVEIVSQLVEIQKSMMDLLQKHQQVIDDNGNLREKIRELQKELNRRNSIEYHYDVYWIRKEDESLDGPFSKKNWEQKEKLVRLQFAQKGNYVEHGECYQFQDYESHEYANIPVDFIKNCGLNPEIYRNQ